MGATSSTLTEKTDEAFRNALWTSEERVENEKAQRVISMGADHAVKHFFPGVRVRQGRKSKDPLAPLWIEPSPDFFDTSFDWKASLDKDREAFLKSVPSGVLIEATGRMKVVFGLTGIEYDVHKDDFDRFNHFVRRGSTTTVELEAPAPPQGKPSSTTSLSLFWKECLPFPCGIVQHIELQYSYLSPTFPDYEKFQTCNAHIMFYNEKIAKSEMTEDDKNEHLTYLALYREMEVSLTEDNEKYWQNWQALVSKSVEYRDFTTFLFDNLRPGVVVSFRMRYRIGSYWSSYSRRSLPLATFSAPPDMMMAPTMSLITSVAVEVTWKPPMNNNGATIEEYFLFGRCVGDDFELLYQGNQLSQLVTHLQPEFAYSFYVVCKNCVGSSNPSPLITVQTPVNAAYKAIRESIRQRKIKRIQGQSATPSSQRLDDENKGANEWDDSALEQFNAAMNCRAAWKVFYDEGSRSYFYFNTITSVRQREIPSIMQQPQDISLESSSSRSPSQRSPNSNQNSPQKTNTTSIDSPEFVLENSFRVKRFRFIRLLKQYISGQKSSNRPHKHVVERVVVVANSPLRQSFNANSSDPESIIDAASILMFDDDFGSFKSPTPSSSKTIGVAPDLDIELGMDRSREGLLIFDFRRPVLLGDGYRCLLRCTLQDFSRRVKIRFEGEAGIDSGGLGKEAFILLSRQLLEVFRFPVNGAIAQLTKQKKDSNKEHLTSWMINREGELPTGQSCQGWFFDEEVGNGRKGNDGIMNHFPESSVKKSSQSGKDSKDAMALASQKEDASQSVSKESLDELQSLQATRNSLCTMLGLLMAKALLDRQLIDVKLNPLIYRYLVYGVDGISSSTTLPGSGVIASTPDAIRYRFRIEGPVEPKELDEGLCRLRYIDAELCHSLEWMLNNDITNVIEECFSVTHGSEVVCLCPNGNKIPVTELNKKHYIRLLCAWRTEFSIQSSLVNMLQSFHSLVPLSILQKEAIDPEQLEKMLIGKSEVDVDELRAYCIYQGKIWNPENQKEEEFNEDHSLAQWFFQLMYESNEDGRRSLLLFFTGSKGVPLDGFDPPLTLTIGVDMEVTSLPRAHTCFHQLVLPIYPTYEVFKDKLLFAISNTEGFDLS